MTQLKHLRGRLRSLARRRQAARLFMAAAAAVAAVAMALLVLMLLDRTFEMSRPQRVVALIAAGTALYWAWVTYCRPLLRRREDEIDIGLLLQRAEAVPHDLVAALEFESAEQHAWGSPQLRHAVVEQIETNPIAGRFPSGVARGRLMLRLLTAALLLLVLAAVLAATPLESRIFWHRLLLSNTRYPTDTTIAAVAVHGRPIDLTRTDEPLRIAYGSEVNWEVRGHGLLPAAGEIRIADAEAESVLALQPTGEGDSPSTYQAALPRLLQDWRASIHLGDATPVVLALEVIQPPVVELTATVVPPDYAREDIPPVEPGTRFLQVLAGSSVRFELRGTSKPLDEVVLHVGETPIPMVPVGGERRHWVLPEETAELDRLTEPVAYRIEATDADGLAPLTPPSGRIAILPDRPPVVSAEAIVKRVLPEGRPEIVYSAEDDFQLGPMSLQLTIRRGEEERAMTIELPVAGAARQHQGRVPLPLAGYDLSPGDRVEAVVTATDARGSAAAQTGRSNPLVFEITDLAGVLEVLSELDQEALQDFNAIIERQLGVDRRLEPEDAP